VPNPAMKLKPGMTATVRIETDRADDVVRIPASALRFRPTSELLAQVNGDRRNSERRQRGGTGTLDSGLRAGTTDASEPGAARDSWRGQQGAAAGGRDGTRAPSANGPKEQATVWVMSSRRLQPVRIETGLSDGTHVQVIAGPIQPGTEVVTGVASAAPAAGTSSSGSPLLPSFPRRGNTGGRGATGR
jgi:HlyD family secretion protein